MSEVTAWWGAITGTLALAISGYNAWHATKLTRVQLSVDPEMTPNPVDSGQTFAVRVINNSGFDVTIQRAGIVTRSKTGGLETIVLDGFPSAMPMTIQARSRQLIPLTMRSTIALALEAFDHVFAETATGEVIRSSKRHPFVGRTLTELQADAKVKK